MHELSNIIQQFNYDKIILSLEIHPQLNYVYVLLTLILTMF